MNHWHIDIIPRVLHFKCPAGTSRGVYTTRKSWFLRLMDEAIPTKEFWGECAPLPQLSCDDVADYETILKCFCDDVETSKSIDYEKMESLSLDGVRNGNTLAASSARFLGFLGHSVCKGRAGNYD